MHRRRSTSPPSSTVPQLRGLTLLLCGSALTAFACNTQSPLEETQSPTGGTGGASSGGSASSGGDGNQDATGGMVNAATGGSSTVPQEGDAPSVSVSYEKDATNFVNPERGFYTYASLTDTSDFEYVREQGLALAYTNVELADYLGDNHSQDLSTELLDAVSAGFEAVRAARIKAIVRFRYDSGEGYPGGANDAPESWIIRHIEQLAPLLQANEDVLFQLQAGFIGAWGEWHTSQNFADGTTDAEARKRVLASLLAALPTSRRTAVRYPAYKRMFYGETATTLEDLLSNTDAGRVGHLNDCFVSGDDDVGTYQYEPMTILKEYLEADSAFVPLGGETCAVHARNECSIALSEMERFHYTYLNQDFHPDVLSAWETAGCRSEMDQRLGYRLSLTSASIPQTVRPGGSFTLEIGLDNDGFAALTNPRPIILVLEGESERIQVVLPADPRAYLPGAHAIQARLQLPTNLAEGSYRLALWLPDADEDLRQHVEYSIRLANMGVWNSLAGDNTLALIEIDDDAAGDANPTADVFAVID